MRVPAPGATWKAKRLSQNGTGTRRDPEPGRDKGGTSPPPKPRRAPCGPEASFEYYYYCSCCYYYYYCY